MSNNELLIELKIRNLEKTLWDMKKQFEKTWNDIEKNVWGKMTKTTDTIWQKFSKLATTIRAVFAWGVVALFTQKMINLGSQLEETQSKFDTTFESSKQFEKEIVAMSDAVGRSELQLKWRTSTIGNILQPIGFSTEASAELSKEITKLAIDVASFNNVSDDQAVRAFTSALTWEREALKTLGIAILETDVQNKAYQLWLAKQWEELSKTTKALATYQLLLDGTKRAQWDAVKTADSYSNQVKRIQGIVNDVLSKWWRDLSNELAGSVKQAGTFIETYGSAMIALFIEVWKSALEFGKAVTGILEALWVNFKTLWEDWVTFWNVILTVLHALNIGLRWTALSLVSFVKLAVAVAKDTANTFGNMWDLIGHAFGAVWASIAGVIIAGVNNAIAVAQKWVNKVVGLINSFTSKINSAVGTNIGTIGTVAERGFLDIQDVSWQYLDNVNASRKKTTGEMWKNRSITADWIADDFLDLWAYVITQENKIAQNGIKSAGDTGGAYTTAFKDAKEFAKDLEDSMKKAWWWGKEWADTAKEAMKKLEDQIKDTSKEAKELEKSWEDYKKVIEEVEKSHEKMRKTIWDWLRELQFETKKLTEEYQKTVSEIEWGFQEDKNSSVAGFLRSATEEAVELQQQIKEVQKEYENETDSQKRYELDKERLELQTQLEAVQKNIAQVAWEEYKTVLETERARANMTQQQKDLYDFQQELAWRESEAEKDKRVAQEKYEAELERIEKIQKVYELFDNMQSVSVKDLEKLKQDERLATLDLEQQKLFESLIAERIEYQTNVEAKRQMEFELQMSIRALEAETTSLMKNNLASLSEDYRGLIGQIQSAISAQKQLISLKAQQRYKGWPVDWWTPYLVWENADGTPNATTELFVPRQSGTIVPAHQVQEALKSVVSNTSIDNSRKLEWITINTQQTDVVTALQKLLFRL